MSKVLVVIKSMGIGDLSILISSIHTISKKIAKPVTVLAQENTRAHAILKHDPHVEEVIELNENEIKEWIDEAEDSGELSIDTETTSLDPPQAELVGISISTKM